MSLRPLRETVKISASIPPGGINDVLAEDAEVSLCEGAKIKDERGNILGEITHVRVIDGKIEVEGVLYGRERQRPAGGADVGGATSG